MPAGSTHPRTPRRTTLWGAFAVVYLVWGSTYLAIRYAIQTIPPFFMAATRFAVAGALLTAFSLARGAARPTARQARNAAVVGALLLAGGNGGVVWAEQTVPSGVAALLVATVPIWLVVLDWLRPGGERPGAGVAVGLAVGLAGMVALVGVDAFRGHSAVNLAGVAALTAGSILWAAGSLFARGTALPASGLLASGVEMLAGAAVLVLIGLGSGEGAALHPAAASTRSLLALAYLVTFGSVVGYSAYSWLVQHTSPAALGTYAYVNPVVAVLLGWLIAREPVTARTIAGAAIIIVAVAIISASRRPRTP